VSCSLNSIVYQFVVNFSAVGLLFSCLNVFVAPHEDPMSSGTQFIGPSERPVCRPLTAMKI